MTICRRQLLISAFALAALAGVAMSPHLLGSRVASARSLALALLVVVASITGAVPLWPVFALCALVAVLATVGFLSGRVRRHPRIAQVIEGFAALERSPRALATVLAWTLGMVACRLAARRRAGRRAPRAPRRYRPTRR